MPRKGSGHHRRLKWGDGWVDVRTTARGETRYLARWREDDPATGARVVRSKGFSTQSAAEAHLRAIADDPRRGFVPPDRLTVSGLLASYLDRGASRWSPGTLGIYRGRVKTVIGADLGKLLARDLSAPRVQHWLDTLVRRGLAAETIVSARRVLSGACKEAVVLGILPSNPVIGTRTPSIRQAPATVWTAEEVRRVLATVADDPLLNACYRVALSTGVRPGELLALRWSDLDLERGVLHVRRTVTMDADHKEIVGETTKGKRARAIALSFSTVDALKDWRKAQVERRLASRWWDDADAVVTDDGGRRIERRAWASVHDGVVGRAGVPRVTPHSTRHTFATLSLERGISVKIVSEILGHRSTAFTSDRYQHVDEHMQRDAIKRLSDVFDVEALG